MVFRAADHGRVRRQRYGESDCFPGPDHFRLLPAIALGGWLSAIFQGRVAAASINIVAKRPDEATKGIILCGIVEFYAILSLLATILLLMNAL